MASGSGDVAFRAGETVLVNSPWVWTLDPTNIGLYCDNCFICFADSAPGRPRLVPVPCKGCSAAFYCSLRCLVDANKSLHRFECKLLQNCRLEGLRAIPRRHRCVTLALLKSHANTVDESDLLAEPKTGRTWNSLLSHYQEFCREQSSEFATDVRNIQEMLSLLLDSDEAELLDEISTTTSVGEALGKFATNSFTISDRDFRDIGCGIYLSGSAFDHSCHPNASKFFVGNELHVYALDKIVSFSQVKITYIYLYDTGDNRRKTLQEGYHFECCCEICGDSKRDEELDKLLRGHRCQYSQFGKHCRKLAMTSYRPKKPGVLLCEDCANLDSKPDGFTEHSAVFQITEDSALSVLTLVREQMATGHAEDTRSALDYILEAVDSTGDFLLTTNLAIHELLDRGGECARRLKLHQTASECYARTLLGHVCVFPEGSYEIFVQFERWLVCLSRYLKTAQLDGKSMLTLATFFVAVMKFVNVTARKYLGSDLLTTKLTDYTTWTEAFRTQMADDCQKFHQHTNGMSCHTFVRFLGRRVYTLNISMLASVFNDIPSESDPK